MLGKVKGEESSRQWLDFILTSLSFNDGEEKFVSSHLVYSLVDGEYNNHNTNYIMIMYDYDNV